MRFKEQYQETDNNIESKKIFKGKEISKLTDKEFDKKNRTSEDKFQNFLKNLISNSVNFLLKRE
jgi:hypothetical protein